MKRSAPAAADPRHHLLPSADSFIEYFPQGLKVLLVGTDDVTQSCIETQLPRPYYQITKCPTGALALEFLQVQAHHSYDLVLSDVFLKDMDGYQFIRDQHLTTNIPHVVILSGSERSSKIVTAYRCGACYVLWKRLMSASELRNLWQHVCRRREQRQTETDFFNDSVVDDDHQQNRLVRQHQHQNQSSNSSLVASQDQSPNEVENDSEFVNNVGEPPLKKRRIVWTNDLHAAFVDAVNQLGPGKAVPKTILEAMNVPFLTREHIASHLQKYREKEKKQHPQDIISVMPWNRIALSGPGETSYGRFGNNNNNNEALAHISAQPASSVRHPDMLMFHHPPQNPNNNPHLLEPSTTNSIPPPNPYQSHFTAEDVALWSQAILYHHFARQQMQMQPPGQNFNLGRVVPLAMAPGSNMQQQQITQNLVSGMQQLDPNIASGSSYGCNMQQLDQNLALGTSYGNNIQQLNQNLAGSNGIMNQNLALGTSFGSNMQQQQQIIQNFTSSMQQLNQNPVSGSSYESNIQQQQISQNLTSGMQQLDQNLALVSSYGSNLQLDQNPVPGSSYGNNMQQQQFDQNLASGSCYITTTRGGTNGGIVEPEATPVRDHDEFCGNPDNHQFDQATSNTDVIGEDLDDFLI